MTGSGTDLLLPPGTRLLHIGPHKTGTTALQAAFHRARASVAAQGVHYAGRNVQPMGAAYAVTARTPTYAKPIGIGRWRDLVREVEGAGDDRVVISSEGFCDAGVAAIQRIDRDLGRDRLHVVMTLRPVAAILPSQYQQFVQGGLTRAYEPWLQAILADPPANEVSPMFWHRHRHDALVARWAGVVGVDRVTVIVADDREPEAVPRLFERLLGLEPETLELEWNSSNRSLTRSEIGLVRALNLAFRSADMLPMAQNKVMRLGVTELIKRRQPGPAEPRLVTPPWALERAGEISRQIVEGIAASGVRVIGDLEGLAAVPSPRRAPETEGGKAASEAWPEIIAAASLGALLTSGAARGEAGLSAEWPDPVEPAAARAPGGVIADPSARDAGVISNGAMLGVLQLRFRVALRSTVGGLLGERLRTWLRRSPSIHSTKVEVE